MATPSLPVLRDPQAFPVLTDAQIERVRHCGMVRRVEPGDILFEPDQTSVPFFVLLSGAMEIVQPEFDHERPIAYHGPGEFTGEMTMISGQQSLVRGRVTEAGEFVELSSEALREMVAKDAELGEILLRAFILRRLELVKRGYGNAVLLGSRHSAETLELREFMSRNSHPYTYVDLDTDQTSQELLDRFGVTAGEVPVIVCHGRHVLRRPSIAELANCLGLNPRADHRDARDVLIVGAGPAGLAAAVYAASEGLKALIVETRAPGGQAGSSSRIENYLGFPTGVSGQNLATRAIIQARKFGAEMIVARSVSRLDCSRQPYELVLEDGERLAARCVVIATGAQYNKLSVEGAARFEGNGIYYGATHIEAQLCESEEVAVVGGGNSAGQAAVFLSNSAARVHLLVRRAELASTMSRYLIQRLTENPKVELHWRTEITGVGGGDHLEELEWIDKETGATSKHAIRHVFVMTGASPRTEWLRGCIALDAQGFILTGRDAAEARDAAGAAAWPLERPPQMLETSLPGVFAVGDARAGNVKRVASAVGEGAISIHMVHRTLAGL